MKIEYGFDQSKIIDREIKQLTKSERNKRVLKGSGLFFVLALISVPLPMIHLFLVPFFLALSIVIGRSRFKQIKVVDLTGVACPSCGKSLKEGVTYLNKDHLLLYCYDCKTQLKIT